ncbi:MAG TPA: glycogen debranching enzyme N-terminal domain-containing protein [Actinomycetota bacterium]|nr:glycogen debranching enzyme N-terminal domain-containing protein [Actinomycetota bacterium]
MLRFAFGREVLGSLAEARLAVHEWGSGAVEPLGHLELASFVLEDGIPRWRWSVGDVIVEREVAMVRGRPAVGVTHRLIRAPQAVRIESEPYAADGISTADASPARIRLSRSVRMASYSKGYIAFAVLGTGRTEPGGETRDTGSRPIAG